METYVITRHFFKGSRRRVIERGLSLQDAQAHCKSPQASSSTAVGRGAYTKRVGPWFDGYDKE